MQPLPNAERSCSRLRQHRSVPLPNIFQNFSSRKSFFFWAGVLLIVFSSPTNLPDADVLSFRWCRHTPPPPATTTTSPPPPRLPAPLAAERRGGYRYRQKWQDRSCTEAHFASGAASICLEP